MHQSQRKMFIGLNSITRQSSECKPPRVIVTYTSPFTPHADQKPNVPQQTENDEPKSTMEPLELPSFRD